jgi:transportin-3
MLQITYDLHQLQREELVSLRDSLINLLVLYRTGARPIRTQLCVSLAGLALQMLEWKDVIGLAVQALGNDQHGSVVLLEFLTVLPEEVTDGRKVSLSVSSPSLHCSIVLRVYGAYDCNRRMNYRIEHRSC